MQISWSDKEWEILKEKLRESYTTNEAIIRLAQAGYARSYKSVATKLERMNVKASDLLTIPERQKEVKLRIGTFKKQELIDFTTKRCRHGFLYSRHTKCFNEEYLDGKRCKIGFFDIETSDFNADVGMMLSYCIKEEGKRKIWYGVSNRKDQDNSLDKKIIQKCIKDLQRFDKIIGYYSTGFDIPFIRARAFKWKLPFPFYGLIQHKDVYYMVRAKLKLKRKSMQKACEIIFGESLKTHFDAEVWLKATRGDKKSLMQILDHNKRDVKDLERLYNKMNDFVKGDSKSI